MIRDFIKKQKLRGAYFLLARYFIFWANISLKRWRPRVIAVTGSAGKTTCIHIIESQIGDKAHVSHNANSVYGLAFDVLGLQGVLGNRWRWLWLVVIAPIRSLLYRRHSQFFVAEMDAERPGEAKMIAKWLQPELCLWTSVSISHAAKFDSQTNTNDHPDLKSLIESAFLQVPLNTQKLVILPASDKNIQKIKSEIKVKNITANSATEYEVGLKTARYTIDGVKHILPHPAPSQVGDQISMVVEMMKYLKLDYDISYKRYSPPPGRSSYFRGVNGLDIIDSTFNAQPASTLAVLDMFSAIKSKKPKWLVLSDMVDQGSYTEKAHRSVVKQALLLNPEVLILVGPRMAKYGWPVTKSARSKNKIQYFETPKEALDYLRDNAREALVLFKGSRFLEGVTEALLLDSNDANKLCRRQDYWQVWRQKWGL